METNTVWKYEYYKFLFFCIVDNYKLKSLGQYLQSVSTVHTYYLHVESDMCFLNVMYIYV